MKLTILCLAICCLHISCASQKMTASLSERIKQEETRTLNEIRGQIDQLIQSHDELSEEAKIEVKEALDLAFNKQQELRDQEAKIVSLLLQDSLQYSQLTSEQRSEKSKLKKILKATYVEKSKNLIGLIDKFVKMSDKKLINESFRNDTIDIMRNLE